ncbi:MAG TPA: type II toxin-antitoxin system HicB family antitoxin [Ktedonobacterales bacterium]
MSVLPGAEQVDEVKPMPSHAFIAVVHREDDQYVALCPEVGTISQGATIEEAVANLKEATELYLEEEPEVLRERSFITVTTFTADVAPDVKHPAEAGA